MKRGFSGVILIGVLLVIAGIVSLLLLDSKTSAPEQTSREPLSSEVMLRLPGTEPIPVLYEDFRLSGSTWVIVSKSRPLPQQEYSPVELTVPPNVPGNPEKSQEEQSVRSDIVEPLTKMLSSAKQSGHDMFIASGYRSFSLQEKYYTNYVKTSGQAEADRFSAKPGHSEHQTGLSLDLSVLNRQCYLEICFGEMPAGIWLADNAHKYGFIVRYPADKTAVTGYQYEPWHMRYVGTDLAGALHESNKTLDEIIPELEAVRTQLVKQNHITE